MCQETNLTIGIPVRNESRTLEGFIISLKASADLLPAYLSMETIICINGSTDNSEEIAKQLAQNYEGSRLNILVVRSREGKVEAQREILTSRCFRGMVAFFDADTVLHSQCLPTLWEAMQKNLYLQVAYARVKALNHGCKTITEWIESAHYAFPDSLTPRKYFHGRGYIIRNPELLFLDAKERERIKYIATGNRFSWMRLDAGPLVDDIHLSRVLVHRYGLQSIQEIKDAIVGFTAPRTIRDFYRGQRRLLIELRRLDTMFPEHAYLQKGFERKPNRRYLHGLPLDVRLHHFLYLSMERCVRTLVRIDMFLSAYIPKQPADFWVPLESTKEGLGGNSGHDQ